jgi:3-oxoacyl-[acyl-carrier protein] reductase
MTKLAGNVAVVSQTPVGRIGQPDHIANVAVFLTSNDARWLTEERLMASGWR